MLLKLALRNVRRSMRDYAIYFITLTLGVAVFYAFNAIGDSRVLFEVQEGAARAGAEFFDAVSSIMSLLSVVVALVLGFLVLYANRYVLRRRKAEFGTYLLLGMSPARVSGIILVESVAVGVFSLATGLVLGVFVSQFISLATANMLGQALQRYSVVFSSQACQMTLGCFALIFVVVALLNVVQIARCKLIDLLSARDRNEKMPVRNPLVCLVAFVASIAILAVAYAKLNENGLVYLADDDFKAATVLMLLGTLLLFWSLSGFVIAVLTKLPRVYFRGLAMFTTRQIASKVNTAFVSLWVVSVLLFFGMSIFSGGMGMASLFAGDVGKTAPYDATITALTNLMDYDEIAAESTPSRDEARELWGEYNGDAAACLSAAIPSWDDAISGAVQIDEWADPTLTYGDLLDQVGVEVASDGYRETSVKMVGVTQFNNACALSGARGIELGPDEFAIDNDLSGAAEFATALAKRSEPLEIAGVSLKSSGKVVEQSLFDTQMASVSAVLIVPDSVVDSLRNGGVYPEESWLNVNIAGENKQATISALLAEYGKVFPPLAENAAEWTYASLPWPVSYTDTKESVMSSALSSKILIVYPALYIGIVLLVATAAVLSVQQLSDVADSLPRYRMLEKLGCDQSSILRSLRVQVGVYFAAPLVVAGCHSICAIGVLRSSLISIGGGAQVTQALVFGAVAVLVVYALYLLATYFAARSVVVSRSAKACL